MSNCVAITLLPALVAAATLSVSGTEGWTLPPRKINPPESSKAWFAPISRGAAAFDVRMADGAQGNVEFLPDAIRIAKTNDKGYVRIIPREPVKLSVGRKLRVSAEVESESPVPSAARACIRIGSIKPNGSIAYNPRAEGWVLSGRRRMDEVIVTPAGRPQLKAAHFEREEGDTTNTIGIAIYAEGGPSVTTWRNIRVDDVREVAKANYAERGKKRCLKHDFSSEMSAPGVLEARLAADRDHTAKVIRKDGYAQLTVDGEIVPPILFKGGPWTPMGLFFGGRRMHEAGVSLLVASVRFGSVPGLEGSWTTNGFDVAKAVEEVRCAMSVAPDALYAVTVRLDAPVGWCDMHAGETWRTKNGEAVYGDSGHVVGVKGKVGGHAWPWASYHSRVLRDEVKRILSEFIGELKRTGLSKRIVGVHLAGYHDAQFSTACPDWSAPARRAFAASGEKDYDKFLKLAPMELQDDLARHVRAEFGKQIVMFRWCMAAFGYPYCASHDIRAFADSKEIDIIVPQPSYSRRLPGYAIGVKLPFSSLHLNGKLLMHEHDLRTYAVWPSSCNAVFDAGMSRAADIDEWRVIDHKMAGQMIARRAGFWYYDMESGWFDSPEIAEDIAAIVKMARAIYCGKPDPWHPTAAFVVDEADLLALQRADGACLRAKVDINTYVEQIAASGVPFDVYMKSDMDRHPEVAGRYRYVIEYNRATPIRKASTINAEARVAGAYVPLPPETVQVDMNGDFISVHCLVPGRYDFTLPRPCRVVNMKSGKDEPARDGILPLELAAGQTSWFRLMER